jgi:hypothetical protein
MKSLDEIVQLLSNSRWYRSILDESTHIWMNKCTFIYNLDEGGSYTPVNPLIRVNPGSIFGWGLIFIFGGLVNFIKKN